MGDSVGISYGGLVTENYNVGDYLIVKEKEFLR